MASAGRTAQAKVDGRAERALAAQYVISDSKAAVRASLKFDGDGKLSVVS